MSTTLLLLFTSLIITCSSLLTSAIDCRLAVSIISGDHPSNQTLREACDSECYTYVVIGDGILLSPHRLGLTGADDVDGITYCQSKGVKVLLSFVGFASVNQSLFPPEVSAYFVWESYLNPNNGRPIRADGINFGITTGSNDYFLKYAQALKSYSNDVILAVSPGCTFPSPNFNSAINEGVIDLVWPKFFNNPACDYSRGINNVVLAWNRWHESIPDSTKLLFGLATSPDVARTGYMSPTVFAFNVLPNIRFRPKYAGAMLWNLQDEVNNIYASVIATPVCDFTQVVTCHAGNGAAARISHLPTALTSY